jgi:uncharacterized OB-fold protein
MSDYTRLTPQPTPDTQPYWDGLNAHQLRLQRCADCRKVRHYPRPVCDACYSMRVEWIDATGRGTVHSWTTTHHAFHPGFKPDLPYTLVTVDLDEVVRMNAQLRGLDAAGLRIGMKVRVAFEQATEGLTLPVFAPADSALR